MQRPCDRSKAKSREQERDCDVAGRIPACHMEQPTGDNQVLLSDVKTAAHVTSLLNITSLDYPSLHSKKEAELPWMPNQPVVRQLRLCHRKPVCLETACRLPLLDTMLPSWLNDPLGQLLRCCNCKDLRRSLSKMTR